MTFGLSVTEALRPNQFVAPTSLGLTGDCRRRTLDKWRLFLSSLSLVRGTRGGLRRSPRAKVIAKLGIVFGLVVPLAAPAANALADMNRSYPYSHFTGNCDDQGSRADPVGLVFVFGGNQSHVYDVIAASTGWIAEYASQQFFGYVPSGCLSNYDTDYGQPYSAGDAASASLTDRWHVRFRDSGITDATWGRYAFSTPHEDVAVWCGDAVPDGTYSGFMHARDVLYTALNNFGFIGELDYWGNTASIGQCNTWVPHGDGWVYYVAV